MRYILGQAACRVGGLVMCWVVVWPAKPSIAEAQFAIQDLGLLNGQATFGRAINNNGQVAGFASGSSSEHMAFRTSATGPIDSTADALGTLGGTYSQAYGLNDSGQAVGLAATMGDWFYHAFRTGPNGKINTTSDLGTLTGSAYNYSHAFAVNVHGQAVGVSEISGAWLGWPARAFRTGPNQKINQFTDNLGTLGGSYSEARDINSSGQVVGSAYLHGDLVYRAFRTAANAAINPATDDLGTLGGTKSTALGINDSGVVVGTSLISGDEFWHAFRTAANSPINPVTDSLGTLGGTSSQASDVNSSGKVVGYSDVVDGARRAFLFDGTSMHDLNSLIDPSSGWVLVEAWSINDDCQITGRGTLDGISHAFRLTSLSGDCQLTDLCPDDPTKTGPGQCGCGIPDTDSDGDGAADCVDGCPTDPTKSAPGQCGCGTPDTDSDGDGVSDCVDACPDTPSGVVVDETGCPLTVVADFNRDGKVDSEDLAHFILCATGPGIPQNDPECTNARLDNDDDVDMDDFAIVQRCITTEGVPMNFNCAE